MSREDKRKLYPLYAIEKEVEYLLMKINNLHSTSESSISTCNNV